MVAQHELALLQSAELELIVGALGRHGDDHLVEIAMELFELIELGDAFILARRCGWFDSVATRHAQMVNGIDELAVTNVDGLDTLDVSSTRCCVCTQVFGDYDAVADDREPGWASIRGFACAWDTTEYPDINAAWRELITARLSQPSSKELIHEPHALATV